VRYLYRLYSKEELQDSTPEYRQKFLDQEDSTYVDDILTVGSTLDEVERLGKDIIRALAKGQMEVNKFKSSSPELLSRFTSTTHGHSEAVQSPRCTVSS